MVKISEQIKTENKTILILELSEKLIIDLLDRSKSINQDKTYEIHISLFRLLYEAQKGQTKNLNIVAYIQLGIMQDHYINECLKNDKIDECFTIVRSRDELNFMFGCLYTNSNQIVYASEFKHSVSESLYQLVNPDPKSKKFMHINVKNFLNIKDMQQLTRLFQRIMPEVVDLTKPTFISQPTGLKGKSIVTTSDGGEMTRDTLASKTGQEKDRNLDGNEKSKHKIEDQKDSGTITEEENKFEIPEIQDNQTINNSELIEESKLSSNSSTQNLSTDLENEEAKANVDKNEILKIEGFAGSLNIKLTNQLAELFKKISIRFKDGVKMDTVTFLKTLHNMYKQHFKK